MALLGGSPAIQAGNNALIPAESSPTAGAPDQGDRRRHRRLRIRSAAIVVTTLSDSGGPGMTLRDAIDYVGNVDPTDGDTITFAPGLEGTITLTQGLLPDFTANYAIVGPGANLLTIDGQNNSLILAVTAGSVVELSGLTLSDGNGFVGGAINNFGKLVMTKCTVSDDKALAGGGIENTAHWRCSAPPLGQHGHHRQRRRHLQTPVC